MTDAAKAFEFIVQAFLNGEYKQVWEKEVEIIRTALKAQEKPVEVPVREGSKFKALCTNFGVILPNDFMRAISAQFPNGIKIIDKYNLTKKYGIEKAK